MKVSQKQQIKRILEDGRKHCSVQFVEEVFCIDYRRRICDLKDDGLKIKSEPCHGECGRNHTSSPFRYWINEPEVRINLTPSKQAEPVQVGLFSLRSNAQIL